MRFKCLKQCEKNVYEFVIITTPYTHTSQFFELDATMMII